MITLFSSLAGFGFLGYGLWYAFTSDFDGFNLFFIVIIGLAFFAIAAYRVGKKNVEIYDNKIKRRRNLSIIFVALIIIFSVFFFQPNRATAEQAFMHLMVSASLDEVLIFRDSFENDAEYFSEQMENGIAYLPEVVGEDGFVPDVLGFFTYEALSEKCQEKKLLLYTPRVKIKNYMDNTLGVFLVIITKNKGMALPVFFVEGVKFENKAWVSGFVVVSDDYKFWYGEEGEVKVFDPMIK